MLIFRTAHYVVMCVRERKNRTHRLLFTVKSVRKSSVSAIMRYEFRPIFDLK